MKISKKEKRRMLIRIKYNFEMCNLDEWFQCFKEDFEKETGLDFWEAKGIRPKKKSANRITN